jgi:asparagine synthase (glutamine-hydrolysing)
MCGICGVVAHEGPGSRFRGVIESMKSALAHRGPDGEGTWVGDQANDPACLGHRRLAIIDLTDSGAQPMTSADGDLVLVCNGEIYNHHELRRDMEARGHVFKGRSDNEVILPLYAEFGAKVVDHLVGMFAFAIWDRNSRTLFLARDRIGEKPLYYTQTSDGFFFASEIKALLTVEGVDNGIHENAVSNLMMFSAASAPDTFFKGISAVPPASTVTVRDGKITTDIYWSIDFRGSQVSRSESDALEQYREIFQEATGGACESDVDVSVALSGGVDSSAVALAAKAARADVKSYCVVESDDDPEFERSARAAEAIGITHQNIRFTPLDLSHLPHIIQNYDQPLADFSMLYAAPLAQAIAGNSKVALGGSGADEVFGGYIGYQRQRALGVLFGIGGMIPLFPWGQAARLSGHGGDTLKQAAKLPLSERRGFLLQAAAEVEGRQVLTDAALDALRAQRPGSKIDAFATACNPRDYLDAVMYSDLMVTHQHAVTVIPDVSGMATGLEYRAPFLNHRLIEFVATLPRKFTVPSMRDPLQNKALLKKSLESHLPMDLVYARKIGFGYGISIADLYQGPWRNVIERFVKKGRYLELEQFSARAAAQAPDGPPRRTWAMLLFSLWSEIYLFGQSPDALSSEIADLVADKAAA